MNRNLACAVAALVLACGPEPPPARAPSCSTCRDVAKIARDRCDRERTTCNETSDTNTELAACADSEGACRADESGSLALCLDGCGDRGGFVFHLCASDCWSETGACLRRVYLDVAACQRGCETTACSETCRTEGNELLERCVDNHNEKCLPSCTSLSSR